MGYGKRRNLNAEVHGWLNEKSHVKTSQWRSKDENEVPRMGKTDWENWDKTRRQ